MTNDTVTDRVYDRWHRWFAWYPIDVWNGTGTTIVWLRTVERKFTNEGFHDNLYYRLLGDYGDQE